MVPGTIATRLNDPRKGAIVLVCQRLHEADLCGTLLKDDGWTHLCLPAEYEPDHPFVYPDDPRGYSGEPLWPGRFGTDELAAMKRQMSPLDIAGQLQQRPSPGGGGVFSTRAWRFFDPAQPQKPFDDILISWDLAFGATLGADYAVGQVWASRGEDRYLLRSTRDRFTFPQLLAAVRLLSAWVAETYPKHANSAVLVEKAANGPALVDTLRKEIENLYLVPPSGNKLQRAFAVVPLIEAGHVYLPGAALPDGGADPLKTPQWVKAFLPETESFPRGNFDDQVDAMTQALAGFRPGPTPPSP